MGACTSSPPPQRGKLTAEQRALQIQMVLDQQAEEERIKMDLINRERLNLRSKALPMIRKLNTCEEIQFLDVSEHDEDEFREVIKNRSRSNSDSCWSESNGSDYDANNSSDIHSNKEKYLQHMQDHFDKDENDSIAALRANKRMQRKRAKLEAESESKWMIFRDLDAFDEADMVKVAKFMDKLFKVKGKLEAGSTREDALSALGALENKGTTEEARRLLGAPNTPTSSSSLNSPGGNNKSNNNNSNIINSDGSGSGSGSGSGELPVSPVNSDAITMLRSDSDITIHHTGQIAASRSQSASFLGSMVTPTKDNNSDNYNDNDNDDDDGRNVNVNDCMGVGVDDLPMPIPVPIRRVSTDAISGSAIALQVLPPVSPLASPLSAPGKSLPLQQSPGRTRDGSDSFGDENGLISLKRENSMDLLRSGQVVIAGMGSRTSTHQNSPKINSSNTKPNKSSPKSSPKVVSTPKVYSNANTPKANDGSGSGNGNGNGNGNSNGNSNSNSSSSPSIIGSDTKHSDVIHREINKDFQLQNFRIPSGFVTPLVSKAIVDVFKQGGKLSKDSVHKLLRLCYRQFQLLPNTTKITINEKDRIAVVGDIHGQLADLLYILDQSGLPSKNNHYIFNGDFVDRGPYGVEVMCILMALYLSNPGQVTLNRGNHEDFAICCAYGFQAECCSKYDEVTFGMFVEVFNHLPLFAIVNERIFVLHGGLFHTPDVKLAELDLIKRTEFSLKDLPDGGDGTGSIPRSQKEDYLKQLQRDALWSDPSLSKGLSVSARGAGVMFGPDIARSFCETNNISLIVRSHECCRNGFDLPFINSENENDRGALCTIFSASNYGGGGNSAAYMVFSPHNNQEKELNNITTETDTGNTENEENTEIADKENSEKEVSEMTPMASVSTQRKEIRKEKAGHKKTDVTIIPRTDLQYEVNYFHIDDKEHESAWIRSSESISSAGASEYDSDSDSETGSSHLSLTRDLSLHQLILRKRQLLLKSFVIADPMQTGYILKETWADVMQKVLLLHIDWTKMFTALVDEDCIAYLTHDRGNRIDRTAVEGTTGFVAYEKFLENFSLTIAASTADGQEPRLESLAHKSNGNDNSNGDINGNSVGANNTKRNVTGQLVDSLYAHHNELSAIFSFFDLKKDQVISREEFKAGCRIIRKIQIEEELGETTTNSDNTTSTNIDENGQQIPVKTAEELEAEILQEVDAECDMLMDIMNLNGSGYIDINEFFEMFRVSDVMAKKNGI
jgi:hypothetical protein